MTAEQRFLSLKEIKRRILALLTYYSEYGSSEPGCVQVLEDRLEQVCHDLETEPIVTPAERFRLPLAA